jgi:hypothetical protein
MLVQPIDLLSIQDNDLRRKKYEEILKDSEEYKRLLLESYMKQQEPLLDGHLFYLVQEGNIMTNVFPLPVFISIILPSFKIKPPNN